MASKSARRRTGRGKSDARLARHDAQMAQLQQQCEQRVREAHAAGLREAEAAAKARAAAEVQAVVEKLAQSIADLAQMRGRLRKQAEGDTVKLSLAIAKRVLRREVAVDPDAMRGLAMAALEKLQTQEICRVRASTGAGGGDRGHAAADTRLTPTSKLFRTDRWRPAGSCSRPTRAISMRRWIRSYRRSSAGWPIIYGNTHDRIDFTGALFRRPRRHSVF